MLILNFILIYLGSPSSTELLSNDECGRPLQPLSLLSFVLLFLIISPFNKRKGKEIKEGKRRGEGTKGQEGIDETLFR